MDSIEDYYRKVEDIFSLQEFEDLIEEKKKKYEDFLDQEALAHIIIAEHGRNNDALDDIKDIEAGDETTIKGEIVDLGQLRTFNSKNGEGKVRNVRIDDGTGSVKIVFWNEETERVKKFEIGMELKVINGYVQDKGYGLQISPGKWGEVIKAEKEGK
ncbi:MAG: OB-fold nucleic acid binding domain-containing protein [Thermoplasmatota archaeon]